jgi:hypothetical protein
LEQIATHFQRSVDNDVEGLATVLLEGGILHERLGFQHIIEQETQVPFTYEFGCHGNSPDLI